MARGVSALLAAAPARMCRLAVHDDDKGKIGQSLGLHGRCVGRIEFRVTGLPGLQVGGFCSMLVEACTRPIHLETHAGDTFAIGTGRWYIVRAKSTGRALQATCNILANGQRRVKGSFWQRRAAQQNCSLRYGQWVPGWNFSVTGAHAGTE